ALTNVPAIDGMASVAAASLCAALSLSPSQENPMDELLERLRYLLNLPVTATADDIVAHLDKIKEMIKPADGTAAASVSLVDHLATLRHDLDTARTAAASATTPDPAMFVPMVQFVGMQNEVAALTRRLEDAEHAELLEAGISDGRILDAQKDYWSKQPVAALRSYLDVAQPIAALSRTQTGGRTPEGVAAGMLSAEQKAVCTQLGLDPKKYAESLAGQS
ncbi:phage protease, partial [Paraburkholderia sp. BR14261]